MMDDIEHFTRYKNTYNSSRRQFLRRSGGLAALAAFPPALHAGDSKDRLTAAVLFRWEDQYSTRFAKQLGAYGTTAVALQDDPVRQWRDGLAHIIDSEQQLPLLGLTNWSDYLLVRDLAAEARKFPLVEVQLGGSQYSDNSVLERYAQQLVSVAKTPGNIRQHHQVNQLSSTDPHNRSLFAWVIV